MSNHRLSSDLPAARVQRVDSGLVTLLVKGVPLHASLGGDMLDRIAHDPAATPCAGDWCDLRRWPDGPVTVERVRPRGPSLLRADVGGSRGQLLAANLDLVLVVVALVPEPARSRTEQLLALARTSGARPLVVLTKADLLPDGCPAVAPDVGRVAPGVRVLMVSSATGQGLEDLRHAVGGRTAALIGDSGAGKTRLVNALVGAPVPRIARIGADGHGRHRFRRHELVQLPGGGALIDTPGLCGSGLHEGRRRDKA